MWFLCFSWHRFNCFSCVYVLIVLCLYILIILSLECKIIYIYNEIPENVISDSNVVLDSIVFYVNMNIRINLLA